VAVFNDSAGSGFGLVSAAHSALTVTAAPRTVSRIVLRNDTDYLEVDATKSVTYMAP
jgi:hypothetical protein